MTSLSGIKAWAELTPPVTIGGAPQNLMRLADLGTATGYQLVVDRMQSPEMTKHGLALAPLHLGAWSIIELLLRPVVYDDIAIDPRTDQFGFAIEADGDTSALWVDEDVASETVLDANEIGVRLASLLKPVAAVVAEHAAMRERTVRTIAAESMIAAVFRTNMEAGEPRDRLWVEALCSKVADTFAVRVSHERLICRPDDGPPVVFPGRTWCCVLNNKTTFHACPGCPQFGDHKSQEDFITGWLKDMSASDFRETTGRERFTATAASNASTATARRAH